MLIDVMYGGTMTSPFINGSICSLFLESVPTISLTTTSEAVVSLVSIETSMEY